jgi:hypothetical protein
MHQTNPTEMFCGRHLALLREAEDRRFALELRAARSKRRARSDWRMAGFKRAIASWGASRRTKKVPQRAS